MHSPFGLFNKSLNNENIFVRSAMLGAEYTMVNKTIVLRINGEIDQLKFLETIDIKLDYTKCCEEFVSRGLENTNTNKENSNYIGTSLVTEKTSPRK